MPEQKSGHRARARSLPPKVVLGHRFLGTGTGVNKILSVPIFFLMPPNDTANKMAGAKLTKENTIAPWAPRSLNNVLFSARAQSSGTGTMSAQGQNLERKLG